MTEYEIVDLGESWTENALKDSCYTVGKDQIEDLPKIVNDLISTTTSEEIINFRTKNVYHYGNCGEIIAGYLVEEGLKFKLQNNLDNQEINPSVSEIAKI